MAIGLTASALLCAGGITCFFYFCSGQDILIHLTLEDRVWCTRGYQKKYSWNGYCKSGYVEMAI